MVQRQQRKDAVERRRAILAAAKLVFAERGIDVPLEEICAAAGVGRATLYRNFDNRIELVRAIMSDNLDRLEIIVSGPAPADDKLAAYLAEALDQLVTIGGLVYLIRNDAHYAGRYMSHLELMLGSGTFSTFQSDLNVDTVDTVIKMMSGALLDKSFAERKQAAPEILRLALRAIR